MTKQYRLSLKQLALTSLYIGVTGYGGPAIVGRMKEIFVDRKHYIEESEFLTGLSLSQMLPSATGANTMEFLGYTLRGPLGAIVAPVCFVIPAMVLMTILSAIYFQYGQVPKVHALFMGLGAIVVALILCATVTLAKSAVKDVYAGVIAVIAFGLIHLLHFPIIALVPISAVAGLLIYGKSLKRTPDDSLSLQHPSMPLRFWLYWGIAGLITAGVLVMTAHTTATQLFLAMLRVGCLTFGGGFASIPFFQHEAVVSHHWLNIQQFLDGIALGQVTPGPVLITGAFIGYRVLGVWGAVLGTVGAFLPGAFGMFLLAHGQERVKQFNGLRAMVRGIVASFIGVMASITVRLAIQSLTDWKTIVMAIIAAVVLIWMKKDPLLVILGGVAASLILFK